MSSTSPVTARIYRVALVGFSDFERGALASFFRLADRHTPAYVQVDDPEQADLSVVNADHAQQVERFIAARRVDLAVFVGANAPADAIARVARPIEPAQILRGLDQLVAWRAMRFGLDIDAAPGDADTAARPAAAAARPADAPVDLLLADLEAPSTPPADPTSGHGGGRAALVVDDSPIARKFLASRLVRLGYAPLTAASGAEALQLAASQRPAVVFIDVTLGGAEPDGLRVCQQIRAQARGQGGEPPAVVLVTADASGAERVRGSLAGGDAYLSKPLLEPEFLEVLASVDPAFRRAPLAAAAAK